jgi:hypothetical protein
MSKKSNLQKPILPQPESKPRIKPATWASQTGDPAKVDPAVLAAANADIAKVDEALGEFLTLADFEQWLDSELTACQVSNLGWKATVDIALLAVLSLGIVGVPKRPRSSRRNHCEPFLVDLLLLVKKERAKIDAGNGFLRSQRGKPMDTPMPENLTPAMKDIWNVVLESGQRLSREQIEAKLNNKGLGQGTSTLKRNLAELSRRLRVLPCRLDTKPRGYGPREWG